LVRRRSSGELWVATLFGLLAGAGFWARSVPLAAFGTIGVVAVLLVWVWQRECLTNVSYTRTLSQERAMFAEEISLTIEVVNDKLLPLTWLHVEDVVPQGLPITGGSIEEEASRRGAVLHLFLAMLPFGRVRRRLSVTCERRGSHTFGPARLESGDPIGYIRHLTHPEGVARLLVYPKVFVLDPPGVVSRMLFGNERSRATIGDPSRVAGVREYQAGDPLRHVDWRATARSASLLVRVHEPTTAPRVAVFVDLRVPRARGLAPPDLDEFTVSVAASVVTDLVGHGHAVGLFTTGMVDGRAVTYPPTASPSALTDMLELLARVSAFGTVTLPELLIAEGGRSRAGTSLVVISAHFQDPALAAIAGLRRRLPATAIWVGNNAGVPPPAGTVDAHEEVAYVEDWKHRATLELAG
jgi:uncharacterized protein (DUF58 family)